MESIDAEKGDRDRDRDRDRETRDSAAILSNQTNKTRALTLCRFLLAFNGNANVERERTERWVAGRRSRKKGTEKSDLCNEASEGSGQYGTVKGHLSFIPIALFV